MRPTCLFCHGRLPTNAVIEAFPVGKRVAYDPSSDRFWVVCTGCRRWNLAPLVEDERKSAIDWL